MPLGVTLSLCKVARRLKVKLLRGSCTLTMFLFLVGRVWGWQRVQAGPMVGRRVTDRGSECSQGKIVKS